MKEMSVLSLCVGQVQTNCYLAYHEDTREAVIVDPGDDELKISRMIFNYKLKPVAILLTHGHFDHIMAVEALRERFSIPVYAHELEEEVLQDVNTNLSGPWVGRPLSLKADYYLTDDEEVELAGFVFKVIHTPGHTIGGVSYYVENEEVLFSGDTLFCRSFGRTDLETASPAMLIESLTQKLFLLPDEVKVYPGHNEETTIGEEKKYNPVLRIR